MMNLNSSDLMWLLDRTTEAVRNIDAKNGIITAIIAGLAAVLFSNESFTDAVSIAFSQNYLFSSLLIVCASLATMVVLISLFASIIPRVKCKDDSLIYSGKISKYNSLDAYRKEISNSSYEFDKDLTSQIFINSQICKTKTKWNQIATIALYLVIVLIIMFSVLFAIGV